MSKKEIYTLTEPAVMQLVLQDFRIDVSLKMASAIFDDFMELMLKSGYIEKNGESDGD